MKMSEDKEIQIRDFKFKIRKKSFLARCNLKRLAKGIGPGNWLIGVADDDVIKVQTLYFDRPTHLWVPIPTSVFDDLTEEEGDLLIKEVNDFNENFRKVQSNEQVVKN